MDGSQLLNALFEFVILLFSLSCHECAHAWMASRLGDHTARMQGRVTLNPLPHIDPLGTLLFPAIMIFGPVFGLAGTGMMFGWAKPTPVMTRNFRHIRRDDDLTTLAGPASNLILTLLAFLLLVAILRFAPGGPDAIGDAIDGEIGGGANSAVQALALLGWLMVEVNLALTIFNLLPIPPLDGSHILRNMLPYNSLNTFDSISRWGFLLIFFLSPFVIGPLMRPALHLVIAALIALQPAG